MAIAGSATSAQGGRETAVIEAYGARLALSAPDESILQAILADLPPGWSRGSDASDADSIPWQFAIERDARSSGYLVRHGGAIMNSCADLEITVGLLRLQLRRFVGHHAADFVFVHAGAVAHNGKAILIPGHSFSGKSTLVAALVRAGAVLYSDEYAILDQNGLLRPYREPVLLRDEAGSHRPAVTAEDLGGEAGENPIQVGLVVFTTYRPGAAWNPSRLSAGKAVFALMEHAIGVQERPEQTLAALRRALEGAEVLESERGESSDVAATLLAAA